jgi:hypothetical protein
MLTVWRKRMVQIDAMVRSVDDSQVDCIAEGTNGSLDSTCDANDVVVTDSAGHSYILPGADGVLESTRDANDVAGEAIIAGTDSRLGTLRDSNDVFDDTDDPTMILPGTNGVLQSVPNTIGSWYPGDGSADIRAALRRAYAGLNSGTGNVDPNENAYIDIEVANGKITCEYDANVTVTGIPQYLLDANTYHDGTATPAVGHPDNTYHILGVRKLTYSGNDVSGAATCAPHAVISLYWRTVDNDWPNIYNTVAHELAHHLFPEGYDMHHGPTHPYPSDTTCIAHYANCPAIIFCPEHVRILRNNITRSWDDHTTATVISRESERDSD